MTGRAEGSSNGSVRGARVVVHVEETIDPTLAGHGGCTYQSPPQTREQAMTLVRLLLGYAGEPDHGTDRWAAPIAGGRRTIALIPEPAA